MKNYNKLKALAFAMILPLSGFCQDQPVKDTSTYFSNALFITLIITILILAMVIVAFSTVFKNIAESDYFINRYSNNKNSENKKTIVSVILFLCSLSMMAQEKVVAVVATEDGRIGGLDQFTFYFLVLIIFIELLVLSLIIFQFNFLVKTTSPTSNKKVKVVESKLIMSLTDIVPIEEEDSILLDHDYDGIKELDNNLPPWWKYGFYLTIIVSVIYLFNFHVLGIGDLQIKEYEKEMTQAKLDVDAFMKTSANNVDENTVKLMTDAADIAAGKEVFMASCLACHGKGGEGTVGPNLTDDYWLHAGGVQDIFKSIKYGWVEKGMKSWKEDLSPMQIAQVTSFIKSLRGTNPTNPKAPQGDIYTEASVAPTNDSLVEKIDSLTFINKIDSLSAIKK